MIGGNGGDTDRVKPTAQKDASLCSANRARDCAIKGSLKLLKGLTLLTGLAHVDRRNVPVAFDNLLPVVETDQRPPRHPAHRLKIGFLRVRPAVSQMVCQSKPVQVTRHAGLRNES